ncbi:kinase [Thraustotheca clavata]|uniref:Kinase n=1 Tax=Thraustotheca clavata TaxID=74557 RepID=A0A1V9ZYI5_9STRA|nr:kinase [Thraustotheca clavata]
MEKVVYQMIRAVGGHKNIIQLYDSFQDGGNFYFVLEYGKDGDLFKQLRLNQRFTEIDAQRHFHGIASGLSFLHSHNFAHGDLSLENIVLTNGICKLMDFGLAWHQKDGLRSSAVGKFFYMAPEMYLGKKYDAMKADMWSLGILLLIMLTGSPPFGQSNNTVFQVYQRHGIQYLLKRWQVNQYFSLSAMDLLEKLLIEDPSKRLTISQVLQHPYCALKKIYQANPTQDHIKKRICVQKFFHKLFRQKPDCTLKLVAFCNRMDKYIVEANAFVSFMENILICIEKKTGCRVVIKRLKYEKDERKCNSSVWVNENPEFERRVAKHLNQKGGHENIIRLLKDFHQFDHEHLVFEYCAKGSLFDFMSLSSSKHFSPAKTLNYFTQIVNGVLYMHKRGYAHCDLSLETIYITEKDVIKLGDFGLATEIGKLKSNAVGKYFYMAPEMHTNDVYDPALVDVWSLGIILFIMLTGFAPFEQACLSDTQYQLYLSLNFDEFCKSLRVDHLISIQAMDLLEQMLDSTPSHRLRLHQVLLHPYIVRDSPSRPIKGLNFFQKVLSPLRRRPSVECDSDTQRYETERVLAKALYGDVVLARDKRTGRTVAIKRMQIEAATHRLTLDGNVPIAEDVLTEKDVNEALSIEPRHKNIMAMYESFEEDGYLHFVFEYCAQGELFQHPLPVPSTVAALYFRQIVDAIAFMHTRGYAHRDISLENVLMDGNVPKVCDFGLAIGIHARVPQAVGKTFYMAPEMYLKKPYDPVAADVWALGILLVILLTGAPPFSRANDTDKVFAYVKTRGITPVLRAWKLIHLVPAPALDLLERILIADPSRRLSMQQLLEHPFVKDPHSARPRKRVIIRRWLAVLRRRVREFLKNMFPSVPTTTAIASASS